MRFWQRLEIILNKYIETLMREAGYAAPELATRAQDLVRLLVQEISADLHSRGGTIHEFVTARYIAEKYNVDSTQ